MTVNGISAVNGQPALWALLGNLVVGQTDFGSVKVLDLGLARLIEEEEFRPTADDDQPTLFDL